MAEPKTQWVTNVDGHLALVDVAAADLWKVAGWNPVDEPAFTGDRMVWLRHETTGGRALFAAAVVPIWSALGWHPTDPPAPIDLTKDPDLVDVKEEPAASDRKAAKPADKSTKEQ
jgi:hypothetical protein